MSAGWAERLRMLLDDGSLRSARRLARGRALHGSGRVSDVRVAAGLITGKVQGTRATPHAVSITVEALDDEQWSRVVGTLGGQVRHSARLLAGQAPEGLDAVLAAEGISLLVGPSATECNCADEHDPCAHVAALWDVFAQRVATDPFVLLGARGRGRQRLLAELSAARGHTDRGADIGIPAAELEPQAWDTARADLDDLVVESPTPARTRAPLLRILGDPPGWPGGVPAEDLFGPAIEQAARWARER